MEYFEIYESPKRITLNRKDYNRIKSYNKDQLEKYLNDLCQDAINKTVDGIRIHNELSKIKGIGTKRLDEITNVIDRILLGFDDYD